MATRPELVVVGADHAKCEGWVGKPMPPHTTLALSGLGATVLGDLSAIGTAAAPLRRLDVSNNALTRLSNVATVPQVTWLLAAHNRLTGQALVDVAPLTGLTVLNVGDNTIGTIPPGALRAQAGRLQALIANNNRITDMTPLCHLTALNTLILSHNALQRLPPALGALTALTKLNLGHNALTALPDELSSLTALAELRVNHNKLAVLPPALATLPALRILDLGNNSFATMDALAPVAGLRRLQNLNLRGNPVCGGEDGNGTAHVAAITAMMPRLQLLDNHRLPGSGGKGHSALVAGGDAGRAGAGHGAGTEGVGHKRRWPRGEREADGHGGGDAGAGEQEQAVDAGPTKRARVEGTARLASGGAGRVASGDGDVGGRTTDASRVDGGRASSRHLPTARAGGDVAGGRGGAGDHQASTTAPTPLGASRTKTGAGGEAGVPTRTEAGAGRVGRTVDAAGKVEGRIVSPPAAKPNSKATAVKGEAGSDVKAKGKGDKGGSKEAKGAGDAPIPVAHGVVEVVRRPQQGSRTGGGGGGLPVAPSTAAAPSISALLQESNAMAALAGWDD